MVNKTVYPITNPTYRCTPTDFPPINGYLIVGKKGNKAVINHFGENVMPHDRAVEWYRQQKVEVVRVYTGGQIIKLTQLKERLNQKPIDKAIGELERELLK
ncbi:MAG TPA: hypothetical protein VJ461_00185 [Candidatus Nanoarchaeia archaeon]|nr:hypothetical protein [Candidatus Nanoarchaeia archaeon]